MSCLKKKKKQKNRDDYSPYLSNSDNLLWLTKVKILKCYSGFVRFETSKTKINLPIDARQERFFFSFNSHEFPPFKITVRRKKPRGTSSLIHFFNKPLIVKKLFIETGA